jgi:GntR family transcriptional repressor for pyruvate dehydrogenase complex
MVYLEKGDLSSPLAREEKFQHHCAHPGPFDVNSGTHQECKMLRAVIKRRAYQNIVDQISDLIESGKLKRGDQLPTEKELSDTFKLSRASVRDAILSLETMKLVERRQGNGTYVIRSNEEALVPPLASALCSEKDTLIDIFHLRLIVEPEVAILAAENATEEHISELESILQEWPNNGHWIQQDARFHLVLVRMAKNRVLERLLLAIHDLMSETRDEDLQSRERRSESLKGHQRILAAIKSKNGKAARQAMRKHLEGIEKIVVKISSAA